MHPIRRQNVDSSGERRRYRRNEYRKTPILQFFNDEGRHEGLFDLSKRWLPRRFLIASGHLLRQAAKKSIARNLLKESMLHSLPCRPSDRCGHRKPYNEAQNQNHKQRKNLSPWHPLRKHFEKGFTKPTRDFATFSSSKPAR